MFEIKKRKIVSVLHVGGLLCQKKGGRKSFFSHNFSQNVSPMTETLLGAHQQFFSPMNSYIFNSTLLLLQIINYVSL